VTIAAFASSLVLATAAAASTVEPQAAAPGPHIEFDENETPASNMIFFEALGSGLIYSVNYERRLIPNLGLRAGASFFTYKVSSANGSGNLTLITFPLMVSYYIGSDHHKLELGLGATILYFSAASDSTGMQFEGAGTGLGIAANGVVGYRYFPRDNGFTLGVGFTPLLRATKGFLPWGGLSVGYVF
jgi:hypothetical protein